MGFISPKTNFNKPSSYGNFGLSHRDLFLSPDLDLKNSIPTKNWGKIKPIYLGYHWSFKHRGISHSIISSSFTKIAYLSILSLLALSGIISFHLLQGLRIDKGLQFSQWQVISFIKTITVELNENQGFLISAVCGLALSDWFHIVVDKCFSGIKKLFEGARVKFDYSYLLRFYAASLVNFVIIGINDRVIKFYKY